MTGCAALLLLFAASSASASDAVQAQHAVQLEVEVADPSHSVELFAGPLPLHEERTWEVGRGRIALTFDGTWEGDWAKLDVAVFEVHGKKRELIDARTLVLQKEAMQRRQTSRTKAPPGYVAPDLSRPDTVDFEVAAAWYRVIEATPYDPTAAVALPDGEFAVVGRGATFYRDAEGARVVARWPAARPDDLVLPMGRPFEVVDRSGEFVQVRGVAGGDGVHCAAGLAPFDSVDLGLWVRAADLLPVTSAVVTVPGDGAPAAVIRPGAPVLHHEAGRARIVAGTLVADLPVPDGAVATSYRPVAPFPPQNTLRWLRAERVGAIGQAGGGPLVASSTLPVALDGQIGRVVTLRSGCGRFTLVEDPRLLTMVEVAKGPITLPAPTGVEVPAGVTASWPDGNSAGTTTAPLVLPDPRGEGDGRLCQVFVLDAPHLVGQVPAEHSEFILCFDPGGL